MKRTTKKAIYAEYGIEYANGKIKSPIFGWINPLLINGNDKLGRGVWTFSVLPTNKMFHVDFGNDLIMDILGTCPCWCDKCYATRGRYVFDNVIAANARKTVFVRLYTDFLYNAIVAQIQADKIKICRIHAAGDFCDLGYIGMWRKIVQNCPETVFWTYTKNNVAENAFDDLENINVVKSCIPGIGFNFGHCDYIIRVYHALKAAGKKVYICRCGIDKMQHCTNCHACIENEIVLFIEHSTEYKAEKDPLYPEIVKLIESQNAAEMAA